MIYLFENNWLTGPMTEEELLSKFDKTPDDHVPPIWDEEYDDWQSIVSYRQIVGAEDTQVLNHQEIFFKNMPPGELLLRAFRVCRQNASLKTKLTELIKKFREAGLPEYLEEIEEVLKKFSGKKRTSKFGGYQMLDVLGEGGMGKTYKALQVNMDRVVALKVLKSELADDENFINEFLNEAKSIASLNHPNIVHAYESGIFGGRHYLSMEFVDGKSLKQKVGEEERIPILEALEIVLKVLSALQHAHEHKLVHRDVTPGNILISNKGEVKLTDYGLAQKVDTVVLDESKTSTVRGSPYFISPEQLRGLRNIDIRADIYGLGCTFFYILTGVYPFGGKSIVEVANKHLKQPMPDIQAIIPEVSDGLKKVIEKMTMKDRQERYQQPHDVMVDIMEERERYLFGGPPLQERVSDNLKTINQKRREWVEEGGEINIVLSKENREFTHLLLSSLEEALEKSQVVDEFFGYACTVFTELTENAFDHGCVVNGKISIQMEITTAFFRIIVEDTGPGFDYKGELEKIKKEKGDRERRRGMFQILSITKSVTFNDRGNRVKAVIYRKSANTKIMSQEKDNIYFIEINGKGDNLLTREFENFVSDYDLSDPKRVCLMIRTPWVASLFVTHLATLTRKLRDTGSPFCVFVENHSCYRIMRTLGVTEMVKTYESMNDALAYLNFSKLESSKPKDAAPAKLPGYHGKPKVNKDTDVVEKKPISNSNKSEKIVEESAEKSLFGMFKKKK